MLVWSWSFRGGATDDRSRFAAGPGPDRDGAEAKAIVLEQLGRALEVIGQHDPARIAPLGGECSVSVAPFSYLARRYGDDLAIVWIDSHPDIGTPRSRYPGYHAMAVAALTGHGDPDVLARRIVADLDAAVDVVAFTVAEFIPRQVISLQQLL